MIPVLVPFGRRIMVKKHASLILQLEQSNQALLAVLKDIDIWLSAPRTDQQTINAMRHRIQKAIAKAEKRAV
jgi:hypothetical protein